MIISICDDQINELENIKQIVLEYAKTHLGLHISVNCFLNPLDMLEDVQQNGVPDIALLDICMPGILGTEIAKELQNRSDESTDVVRVDLGAEAVAVRPHFVDAGFHVPGIVHFRKFFHWLSPF